MLQGAMVRGAGGFGRRQLSMTTDDTLVLNSYEAQLMLLELRNKRILMATSQEGIGVAEQNLYGGIFEVIRVLIVREYAGFPAGRRVAYRYPSTS